MQQLNVLSHLQNYFLDSGMTKGEVIQDLWSGYGEIARFISPRLKQSFIVKHINPKAEQQHPRGWNTQTSHQRKLRSYQIEASFYQQYAYLCDQHCTVPKLFTAVSDSQQLVLVMSDLDSEGFAKRKMKVDLTEVKLVVKWLAFFHGRFLGHDTSGLWPIGTYWHLATRQDEYKMMQDCQLKLNASNIDDILNQAKYQTCVHGDAKLANFCFPDNLANNRLAAVDFQYVGKGIGMKDLAYFLGSCMSQEDLNKHAQSMLNTYFLYLKDAISHYSIIIDFSRVEQEWRALYPYAWADFYRFLLGWSPQHYKINEYMQTQTEIALTNLTAKNWHNAHKD